VWDDHQYWRLGSAMFLHGGLLHFILNAICLFFFGGRVEAAVGRLRYLGLYLAAGLAGNLASLVWGSPIAISVGASGAIFGVVVTYLLIEVRGSLHWTRVARQPASRALFFLIGIQLAMGLFQSAVDSLAHLGGVVTGATLGLFLALALQTETGPSRRRWVAFGLWIGALAGLVVLAIRPWESASREVQTAYFYYLGTERPKAIRHFRLATGLNRSRAFGELAAIIRQTAVLPRDRAYVTAFFIEMLEAQGPALDYYREQARVHPSADSFWLTATLSRNCPAPDYEDALAACAEGNEQFPGGHRWDLLEARIHASFRRFDRALAAFSGRSRIQRKRPLPTIGRLRGFVTFAGANGKRRNRPRVAVWPPPGFI
jgi:membrane associated rhomboid family serine protease